MFQLVDARTPKAKASEYFYTGFVKVIVGAETHDGEKTFHVHEGLICSRSRFFQSAMNGNWNEASERLVRLPTDSATTFALYLDAIYTSSLPILPDDPKTGHQFDTLVKVYVLAEKLIDIKTKNLAVQAMAARGRDGHHCKLTTLRDLYHGTPSISPARRFLVDLFVANCKSGSIEQYHKIPDGDIPQELFLDIIQAFAILGNPKGDVCKDPEDRPEDYMEEETPAARK